MESEHRLSSGDQVEVRTKAEILETLDEKGRLEELPFMPEMFQYCSQRFRVYKRAHKTCDFVTHTGSRRLSDCVHLEEIRCDGAAHGGCNAACLIFWKEAWLKRMPAENSRDDRETAVSIDHTESLTPMNRTCSEEDVRRSTRAPGQKGDEADPTYICQATHLPTYTQSLSPWDIRQYVEDYRSHNVPSVLSMVPRFLYRMFDNLINLGIGLGPLLRWLYDGFQSVRGGLPYPGHAGKIPLGVKTPTQSLNLQIGEMVRVKDYHMILETIDTNCRNRGMSFSAEMVPYCGGVYRVRSLVDRIVNEQTGKMLHMKNGCVILDGVVCQAKYNRRMIFCPRATFPYWREIWLERVERSETAPVSGI